MRSTTLIVIRWKVTGRIEIFNNLGKLYGVHDKYSLDVSRHTLYKKDLFEGFQNDVVEIYKFNI